jgi:spore coat polysaccharide biosynthesis protein SpsF
MEEKIAAVIQARMGSHRLPGKVMLELCGRPVLQHVIDRVRIAENIQEVMVATTQSEADEEICRYLAAKGIAYCCGSEEDVLSRYFQAAKLCHADVIVRITADCPLIDPNVVDRVVAGFMRGGYDYASNTVKIRTFPRGLDCEVFSFALLKRACEQAKLPFQREHVTPFMYQGKNRVLSIQNIRDYSDMRWTLDTAEDFALIQEVYSHFYKGRHDFYMEEIYAFLRQNPQICALNQKVHQKGFGTEDV